MPGEAAPLLGQQSTLRPNLYHTMSVGWRTFLPWAFFTLITVSFTFLYQIGAPIVWTFVVICVGMSTLLMFLPFPWQNAPENKYWYLLLGVLCMTATILACIAGYWNFHRHMATFWAYEGSRTYTNVIPMESALSHLDAGKVTFSGNAKVDVSKAVGHKSGGDMYCVAPIVAGNDASQTLIEYWAVGVNCCEAKGTFTCGDIEVKSAHAGLVAINENPFVSAHKEEFDKAVKEATQSNKLTTSEDALYLNWVTDADDAQADYCNYGIGFLCGMSALHLVLSAVVGILLHFGSRPSPAKKGSQRYSMSM